MHKKYKSNMPTKKMQFLIKNYDFQKFLKLKKYEEKSLADSNS